MNTNYNKHLSNLDRDDIERYLDKNLNFKTIAQRLKKDASGISKEIRLHRIERKPSKISYSNNHCKKYKTCHLQNMCNSNCHKECRQCSKCNDVCPEFEKDLCERLVKAPYVCNGCDRYVGCKRIKFIYNGNEAQRAYEKTLKTSRTGHNVTKEEIEQINKVVSPLVLQGQSIKLIYRNHKDEIPCKISSLYNYINSGLLDIGNLDLPRRVKFPEHRKKDKDTQPKKDYAYRKGRKYPGFQKLLKTHPNLRYIEMDTVEGKKGGKVLLTLLIREYNFMIIRLLPDKTAESVVKEFDKLENILGTSTFKKIFKIILTDNGTEFSNPERLEKNQNQLKRCRIFYCEPNRSDEKGKIENNHRYIRYILKKGTSFDNFTQDDIDIMSSHINSTAREVLDYAVPYDMAITLLGKSTLKKLHISKIAPDNIILKPRLLRKKKEIK